MHLSRLGASLIVGIIDSSLGLPHVLVSASLHIYASLVKQSPVSQYLFRTHRAGFRCCVKECHNCYRIALGKDLTGRLQETAHEGQRGTFKSLVAASKDLPLNML